MYSVDHIVGGLGEGSTLDPQGQGRMEPRAQEFGPPKPGRKPLDPSARLQARQLGGSGFGSYLKGSFQEKLRVPLKEFGVSAK